MPILKLEFHRCPSAMTMTRLFIKECVNCGEIQLDITTIEPMLESHIKAFVATISSSKVLITKITRTPITTKQIEQWSLDPCFDSDDLENATESIVFSITILPKQAGSV